MIITGSSSNPDRGEDFRGRITPVDPGDFVSTVDSTGINSANTNIEAILIKVAIYYSGKLIFCMATFCFYYCLASRLHRIHKAT